MLNTTRAEYKKSCEVWDDLIKYADAQLREFQGESKPEDEFLPNGRSEFLDYIGWTNESDRLEIRRGKCGAPSDRACKTSGAKLTGVYRCGNLRGEHACDDCRRRAGSKMQYEMTQVGKAQGGIYMVKVDKDTATTIVREMGDKTTYRRFPVDMNTDYVVVGQSDLGKLGDAANVEYVRFDHMDTVDWTALTCGIKGRNKSGALGIEKPVAGEEKGVPVEVMEVVMKMDTTEQERNVAWNEATKRTADLDPKTAQELNEAIRVRTRLFIEILGKKVDFVVVRKERVVVSKINWRLPQVK